MINMCLPIFSICIFVYYVLRNFLFYNNAILRIIYFAIFEIINYVLLC
jgi:hypothetical protein